MKYKRTICLILDEKLEEVPLDMIRYDVISCYICDKIGIADRYNGVHQNSLLVFLNC